MPIFTERELQLLQQGCYGNPRLAEWLERMLEEGPGNYEWRRTASGYFAEDELPLYINIENEILHQGSLSPATFVAVPIICDVINANSDISHAELLGMLCEIERSRLSGWVGQIDDDIIDKYMTAVQSIVRHIPDQIGFISDDNELGQETIFVLLTLLSLLKGKDLVAEAIRNRQPFQPWNS